MIRINNLSVNLEHKCLLDVKDLSFSENEFCVLLGANGAGKSTLLKVLTGVTKFNGHIFFKDKTLNSWNQTEIAQHRSVLQQSTSVLTNLSVYETIELGRYPYRKANPKSERELLNSIIKKFELTHFENRPIHSLSGGEQQRVHFARAYAQLIDENSTKKGVLFLDEPLNNLDIQNQLVILHEARDFVDKGKGSVIMVIHDINLANQFSDRVILLKKGKIIADGSPENVLTEDNLSKTFKTSIKVESTLSGSNYFLPIAHKTTHFELIIKNKYGNN